LSLSGFLSFSFIKFTINSQALSFLFLYK
jgi:hypothetical protein